MLNLNTIHLYKSWVSKKLSSISQKVSQNSILKKKRKLLKKHNAGLSTLPERSNNQIKINICTEEENVLEVLSGVDHQKKRTQISGRKLCFPTKADKYRLWIEKTYVNDYYSHKYGSCQLIWIAKPMLMITTHINMDHARQTYNTLINYNLQTTDKMQRSKDNLIF